MNKKKKVTVIDLFSGCGGFSFGFQEAGYDIVLGVDNVDIALKTFKLNHKSSKGLLLDLHEEGTIRSIIK
ncbi:MAG: DNA cytosine methyltransferase, partial [Deltaproteobacteria bacterium]|nr:DNA cytosine methyltransferase [Deltaproteobacteria bacterium]